MTEADTRYLARVADDCAVILGPGISVLGVEREDVDDAVQLTVRYKSDGAVHASVAAAETVAAHAALREQLARDRIAMGFTRLVRRQQASSPDNRERPA